MRRFWWVGLVVVVLLCVMGFALRRFVVQPMPAVKAYVPPARWTLRIYLPPEAIKDEQYFEYDGKPRAIHGWQVHVADANDALRHLDQIEQMDAPGWGDRIHIQHPEEYSLQFLGIDAEGRKRVFVNAFCGIVGDRDEWQTHLAIVADGGTCFWHVTYDPATSKFSDLEINGRAWLQKSNRRSFDSPPPR